MVTKVNNRMIDGAAVNVLDFGAVGDGIADDTAAIQAAIDYATPFEWQGSINAQNQYRVCRGEVLLPTGTYRVTAPIRLAPMLTLRGTARMGWWVGNIDENTGGTKIIGDFDSQTQFILDTANYNNSGVREYGQAYGRNAHDNGLVSQSNCMQLINLFVQPASGRELRGALNFGLAHESYVQGCWLRGSAQGLQISTSWAGSFRDCNIHGDSVGMVCEADITTYVFDNCYITSSKTNPYPWFVYPAYPTASLQDKTACVAARYASPHLINCVFESAQHAVRATSVIGGGFETCYHEDITDYLYVMHTSNVMITPSWTILPETCKMGHFDGATNNRYVIDVGNCSFQSTDDLGIDCTPYTSVYIAGNKNRMLGTKRFNPKRINYETYSYESGYCDVYLSETGDDTNSGYESNEFAVATLQEAMTRCVPGLRNRIWIPAGETVSTKFLLEDGTNALYHVFSDLNVEILSTSTTSANINVTYRSNGVNGLVLANSNITFNNVNLAFGAYGGTDTSYQGFISPRGRCGVYFDDCDITSPSNTSYLLGPSYSTAGIVDLSANNCVWSDINLVDSVLGNESDVMWQFNHAGCTFNTVSAGDVTLRVAARAPFDV